MTTALDSNIGIVSLAEAKEYLKVTTLNDDVILNHLINATSAWIQNYINRKLVAKDYVEYYSGDGSLGLLLKNYPVNSVASIYIDSLRQFGSSTSVAVSTNVIIKKSSGVLRAFNLLGGWPCGESNIKVSYNAGYTVATDGGNTGTMPYEIRMATKRLLDLHYRLGYTQRKLDNSSESIGGMNITFKEDDIPKDVKSMLEEHRSMLTSPQFEYAD